MAIKIAGSCNLEINKISKKDLKELLDSLVPAACQSDSCPSARDENSKDYFKYIQECPIYIILSKQNKLKVGQNSDSGYYQMCPYSDDDINIK